ncbi:DUF481 domain-containing protein [Larkinella soli]|uniref:DUF481 domain-containing protein n=1 Tax=Larkinella soli TaxID=1770527 RepID=UPI001E4CA315|nr:DUF481 domain-containing protein [Larkinella soli]
MMKFLFGPLLCLIFSLIAAAQNPPAPPLPAPDRLLRAVPADTVAADTGRADKISTNQKKASEDTVAASDPTGFHYKLTADGTFAAGNVDRTLIQTSASLDWAVSRLFRFASTPTFAYGRQNRQLNEREFLTDFRTTLFHENRFYYLGFGSIEKSNLRKIRNRFTGGAGVGYKLLSRKDVYLSVTNVLLYEYTDFITNSAEVADVDVLRNSTRILGEYQWSQGRYSLTHTVFMQPALNRRNLRWNGNLTFQVKMTATVSLRTTLQNSYESVVVPGRKNNDFRWTMGVVLEGK